MHNILLIGASIILQVISFLAIVMGVLMTIDISKGYEPRSDLVLPFWVLIAVIALIGAVNVFPA